MIFSLLLLVRNSSYYFHYSSLLFVRLLSLPPHSSIVVSTNPLLLPASLPPFPLGLSFSFNDPPTLLLPRTSSQGLTPPQYRLSPAKVTNCTIPYTCASRSIGKRLPFDAYQLLLRSLIWGTTEVYSYSYLVFQDWRGETAKASWYRCVESLWRPM